MTYDVMIIGSGVAGAAAATWLAGRKQRVVVIEKRPANQEASPSFDWITASAVALLDEAGLRGGAWTKIPFGGVNLHSSDLADTADSSLAESQVWRIDYGKLLQALATRAAKAGCDLVCGWKPADIETGERHVTARFDGRDPVTARFLLLADGAEGSWRSNNIEPDRWIVTTAVKVGKSDHDNQLHWWLGLDRGASLLTWWFDAQAMVVRFHGRGRLTEVRQRFWMLLETMRERGLLPANLAVKEADLQCRPAPAKTALAMDSHVDKGSLRIGDAGGFIEAASREGIYPALKSAQLATDVLVAAAKSTHPQDELRTFSQLWRTSMAEYLRPPNTDLHFLLPLIFNNQQMADRMTAALLNGENI